MSTSSVRVPEIQYSSTASTSTEYEYPSPGRDACRDRYELAVSLEVAGGENVPGIPGACTKPQFYVSGKRTIIGLVIQHDMAHAIFNGRLLPT